MKNNFGYLHLLLLLATCVAASTVKDAELGHFFDITHEHRPGMPIFGSSDGTGPVVGPYKVINDTENSQLNYSPMQLHINSGTHTKAWTTVDELDLETLNGPVLVVEVPKDKNLTAEVVGFLNIPDHVERVLFKTSNSDRDLMHKKEFDSSYAGLTADGAEWLARNTNIKLVGLDYLSVGVMPDREPVYKFLGKDIIPLEGLNIGGVHPGEHALRCLPLSISYASAAPTRRTKFDGCWDKGNSALICQYLESHKLSILTLDENVFVFGPHSH
ncbi:cyclase-like protein 1 [Henckelia pumila]|uniref:cyclase-like protein 1 n=1 Tax=Henckelia pumila TaxID=405737 RepID=UPI003C6E2008